jgi:hypothetical protein
MRSLEHQVSSVPTLSLTSITGMTLAKNPERDALSRC